MKKLLLLLIISILLFSSSKASHIIGGEITWKCLANGKYQFFMSVYRDCTGIPYGFQDETLQILGSPSPMDGFGQTVSTILVKPDMNRWMNERNGDISPECSSQYSFPYTCSNSDRGTVQAFWYQSDPITLRGTPPLSGWRFYWESPCCRPGQIENVNTNGSMLLRAIMYPTPGGQSANSCLSSSPEFVNTPTFYVCRGAEFNYNQAVNDADLDSLVYSWDRPYNPPAGLPNPLSYKPGFSPSNPTPDTSENAKNIPATLNSSSGLTKLAVYSTSGGDGARYITVIRVDAYKDGMKTASVFREIPISFFNCDPMPSGKKNNSPDILFNGIQANSLELNVLAGQKIEIPIQVLDGDVYDSIGSLQTLALQMTGSSFSKAFNSDSLCAISGSEPCAYLQDSVPFLDTVNQPVRYKLKGNGQITTNFNWQTNCGHLNSNGTSKTYYFYFNAQDDHCPIPASNGAVMKVTVHPSGQINNPSLECVNRIGNNNEIFWSKSAGLIQGFQEVQLYSAPSKNGNYSLLTTVTDSTVFSYTDLNAPSSAHYFIRVKSADCNGGASVSAASDRLSNLDLNLSGVNAGECFQLNWNTNNRATKTINDKYIIYREFPMGSGFVKVDSVYNDSSYCDALINCSGQVAYYVGLESENTVCSASSNTITLSGSNYNINNGIVLLGRTFVAIELNATYQWYSCSRDSLYKDSVNRFFSPQDTGIYRVVVRKFGCQDTSECIRLYGVGLKENQFGSSISIHPNPSKGQFFIEGLSESENYILQIRNIQGQLIQKREIRKSQKLAIEIEAKAGIYFIQLSNSEGVQANFKIVKQ